jgi:hypothetical protein
MLVKLIYLQSMAQQVEMATWQIIEYFLSFAGNTSRSPTFFGSETNFDYLFPFHYCFSQCLATTVALHTSIYHLNSKAKMITIFILILCIYVIKYIR